MNKKVTCILITCTLVIVVLMLFLKYKSLTDLEGESTDPESTTNRTVSEKDKKTIPSTKSQKIKSHDPEYSDSLYSKLKANITGDDVLVTGGYKCDNGNMRYSFIQADTEESNGQPIVKIKIKNIEISPETANDSNLDYLKTNNSRIFDHFGILTSEEHKETEKKLNEKGMQVLAMPHLGIQPGARGQIYLGDDDAVKHVNISVKPTILPDGSFDIELEARQSRN